MKRLFAFLIAGAMLLSLCACGDAPQNTGSTETTAPAAQETSAPATQPTAAPTTQPTTAPTTQPPATEEDPQLGSYADGVYTNDFIGIRCSLGEDWHIYSEDEMAQLFGTVAGLTTDEDLAALLESANVAYLFYAAADDGLVTINITLEKLSVLNGLLLDEQSYVELSAEQLPAALESMGMSGVAAETGSISFAGGEHAGLTVHGALSGVDFYERLVCVKVGSYMAIITVASYYEDVTTELLGMFTGT